MSVHARRSGSGSLLIAVGLMTAGCSQSKEGAASANPEIGSLGNIEVTARLVEIPDGAIFERELYNYATVLKYQVLEVHRGKVRGQTIYVGHYNPWKPRSEAADRRVQGVGGTLKSFPPARCTGWHWTEPWLTISREASSTSMPRKTPTRSTGRSGRIWPAVDRPCGRQAASTSPFRLDRLVGRPWSSPRICSSSTSCLWFWCSTTPCVAAFTSSPARPIGGPAWPRIRCWFLQATSSTVGGIPGSSS